MLHSAAAVTLASASLLAAMPAQAAAQQAFPCSVGVQKFSSTVTSRATVNLWCAEARTVTTTITADGVEVVTFQQTVQANVQQSVSVNVPRPAKVCAKVTSGSDSTEICAP
ncbi:hypothetical protein [Streptomyces capitiformicae]|nr:hypothetical protein [Streptomyces capitiformicae]